MAAAVVNVTVEVGVQEGNPDFDATFSGYNVVLPNTQTLIFMQEVFLHMRVT